MSPVDQLQTSLTHHLGAIHHTAASSPAGGGPEWDGLLRHYGITPVDGRERGMIVSCMRLSRGAVPAEVRMALQGLAQWASRELSRLGSEGHAHHPAFAVLQQRLTTLVDAETATYERAIGVAPPPAPPPIVAAAAPVGPSLGSIFANANATAKEVPWAGQTYKSVGNLTCVHCGGPQEKPMDFMCKYCRRPIAGEIK